MVDLCLCQIIVYCVIVSHYIVFIIHFLLHFLVIYLTTAASHEEIATGGQIRGVSDSDQQPLSK